MVFFKKLHTKYLKVFFVYSLVLAIFILISFVYLRPKVDKDTYFTILNFYTFIEFILLSLMIYFYSKRRWVRITVLFTFIIFAIYHLVNYLVFDRLTLNFSHNTVTCIILILYIVFFFYTKMKIVSSVPLYQTMSFWIFVAFFLYYTGNFFFFLILGSEQSVEIQKFMIVVYSVVTIIKNIILCSSFSFNEPTELINKNLSIPNDLNLDDLSHLNQNSQ